MLDILQNFKIKINKKVIEGVSMIKVHYMHLWKYHSETPLYN
jgi:hypothetical protein